MCGGRNDAKILCNAGFNAWLAALPNDDWGNSYEEAIPIYWDEEKGEWLEGTSSATPVTDSSTCSTCGGELTLILVEVPRHKQYLQCTPLPDPPLVKALQTPCPNCSCTPKLWWEKNAGLSWWVIGCTDCHQHSCGAEYLPSALENWIQDYG